MRVGHRVGAVASKLPDRPRRLAAFGVVLLLLPAAVAAGVVAELADRWRGRRARCWRVPGQPGLWVSLRAIAGALSEAWARPAGLCLGAELPPEAVADLSGAWARSGAPRPPSAPLPAEQPPADPQGTPAAPKPLLGRCGCGRWGQDG